MGGGMQVHLQAQDTKALDLMKYHSLDMAVLGPLPEGQCSRQQETGNFPTQTLWLQPSLIRQPYLVVNMMNTLDITLQALHHPHMLSLTSPHPHLLFLQKVLDPTLVLCPLLIPAVLLTLTQKLTSLVAVT